MKPRTWELKRKFVGDWKVTRQTVDMRIKAKCGRWLTEQAHGPIDKQKPQTFHLAHKTLAILTKSEFLIF